MDDPMVLALESTLLSYMSDEVRPTPSSSWLARQPFVDALLQVIGNHILIDPDGQVVSSTANTPCDHWSSMRQHKVRHLGHYTAIIIVGV